MEKVRNEIVFEGRVQGVGFRATTRQIALRFDVHGWVRNESDGTVRCIVEGPAGAVSGFLDALRSRMAGYISNERRDERPASGDLQGFEIRY